MPVVPGALRGIGHRAEAAAHHDRLADQRQRVHRAVLHLRREVDRVVRDHPGLGGVGDRRYRAGNGDGGERGGDDQLAVHPVGLLGLGG